MNNVFQPRLFSGKTVLITGGGTGIGYAIALLFGQLDARVILAARDLERLEDAARKLTEHGIECEVFSLNIRDETAVQQFYATLEEHELVPDILVNNAGGQFTSPALDISANGFRSVMELNLLGTFNMSKGLAQLARQYPAERSIVNIVLCQEQGIPGMAHAAAARAGVVNLAKTLAWEWAPLGFRVNSVAPGTVRTAGLDNYDASNLERALQKLPIKRMAEPSEVAQAVVYLASPAAGFITGINLQLDGGEHLTGVTPQK